MNSKTLGILAIISVVLLAVAIIAYGTRDTAEQDGGRELLFTDLGDRVNDVATVAITARSEAFRIERRDDGWRIVEKGGFPAEFEKIKSAIVGLSQARIIEPKTKKPELYAKLGVDGPDAPESTSTIIGLEDGAGESIATLIVGERSASPGENRWFVRKAGDDQTWLVEGPLQIDADPMKWVDRNIVGIPRDRIQRVEITHPDGESLFVYRDSPEQTDFTVSDVPPERELKFAGAAAPISTGLAFLRIEDVASVDDRSLDPDDTTVTEFRTFDGLVVTARSDEVDEQVWATFDVRVDEGIAAAAEDPAGDSDGVEDEADATEQRDVREEAAKLDTRLGGWVFRLGDAQAVNLRKRMADLTNEKPPLEPETPEPTAGDAGESGQPAGASTTAPAGGVVDPPDGGDGAF